MLCLSAFELQHHWVPLFLKLLLRDPCWDKKSVNVTIIVQLRCTC